MSTASPNKVPAREYGQACTADRKRVRSLVREPPAVKIGPCAAPKLSGLVRAGATAGRLISIALPLDWKIWLSSVAWPGSADESPGAGNDSTVSRMRVPLGIFREICMGASGLVDAASSTRGEIASGCPSDSDGWEVEGEWPSGSKG